MKQNVQKVKRFSVLIDCDNFYFIPRTLLSSRGYRKRV